MTKLDEKRGAIAALIAKDLGFDSLVGLSPAERGVVDGSVEAALDGTGTSAAPELRQALDEYRALLELRRDEADTRLAELGEVFGREDDA